jgi:hypothetical protein
MLLSTIQPQSNLLLSSQKSLSIAGGYMCESHAVCRLYQKLFGYITRIISLNARCFLDSDEIAMLLLSTPYQQKKNFKYSTTSDEGSAWVRFPHPQVEEASFVCLISA